MFKIWMKFNEKTMNFPIKEIHVERILSTPLLKFFDAETFTKTIRAEVRQILSIK